MWSASTGRARSACSRLPPRSANPSAAVLRGVGDDARAVGHRARPRPPDRARHHGGHQCGARAQGRARSGLLATAGFSDVLEIGRSYRRNIYDLAVEASAPVFLAPRHLRKGVVRADLGAGRDRHAARRRVAARRRRVVAGTEGRRHRRRIPLFLRQSGARARGRAGDRRDGARRDGFPLLRHRPRVPRVRAHQHHRLRRLREAGARPLPGRDGARSRRVRRRAHRCR